MPARLRRASRRVRIRDRSMQHLGGESCENMYATWIGEAWRRLIKSDFFWAMTIPAVAVYASLLGDEFLAILGGYSNRMVEDTSNHEVCLNSLESYAMCDSAWDDFVVTTTLLEQNRGEWRLNEVIPWRGLQSPRRGSWILWLALDSCITAVMGICMSLALLQSSRVVWRLQRPLVSIHVTLLALRQTLWMLITAFVGRNDDLVRLGFKFLSATLFCHTAMLVCLRLLVLWADWIISRPNLLTVCVRLEACYLQVTSVFDSLHGDTFRLCCPLLSLERMRPGGPSGTCCICLGSLTDGLDQPAARVTLSLDRPGQTFGITNAVRHRYAKRGIVSVFRAYCGHWFHSECIESWAYHHNARNRRRTMPRILDVSANGDTFDENRESATSRNHYCPVCATTPILKTRVSRIWFWPKLSFI